MVGVFTDLDDLTFVVILVIFAPIALIVGMINFLMGLGASGWLIAFVTVINVLLIGYFLYRWEVVQSLGDAFKGYLQMN